MKIDVEKVKELMNDSKFVSELNSEINNPDKFIDLFKERGINISLEEFNEIIKEKERFSKLSEDELREIAGGKQASPGETFLLGSVLTLIGVALMIHGIAEALHCLTHITVNIGH